MDPKNRKTFQKKSKLSQLLDKLMPKSVEARKQRIQQIRDVSIFAVSVGLFITFEKQIRETLRIDYSQLKQMMQAPPM